MSGSEDFVVDSSVLADSVLRFPKPEFAIALYEDDGTLTLGIHPDGSIERGPNYQPDEAAQEFWDAVTRAAVAASPIPTLGKEQA